MAFDRRKFLKAVAAGIAAPVAAAKALVRRSPIGWAFPGMPFEPAPPPGPVIPPGLLFKGPLTTKMVKDGLAGLPPTTYGVPVEFHGNHLTPDLGAKALRFAVSGRPEPGITYGPKIYMYTDEDGLPRVSIDQPPPVKYQIRFLPSEKVWHAPQGLIADLDRQYGGAEV